MKKHFNSNPVCEPTNESRDQRDYDKLDQEQIIQLRSLDKETETTPGLKISFCIQSVIIYFCSRPKMVAIAQLVRASDCGSEGRGFEPHWLPKH